MLLERSEGGYFSKVISVHPLAHHTRTIPITQGHDLVEFGFDAIPGGESSRLLRHIYAPLYILIAAWGIRRLIRTHRIDVVRASDPYWAALCGWLGSAGTSANFCISIHADWDHFYSLDPQLGAPKILGLRFLAKVLESFLLRKAKCVLCIRRSLFAYAERSGARSEQLRYIPHGVNLEYFRDVPSRPSDLPQGRKLVVFAGRLSQQNYVDDVLAVAKHLAPRGDSMVVFAGGGPEASRLKYVVSRNPDLVHTVYFAGFLPRESVIALRFAATVNLVPMGGFSLIEACASGRPTVAYDVQWHSELIEDQCSGLLLAEGDVTGLVCAVDSLLNNPEWADEIGSSGRTRAFTLHNLNTVYEIRSAVYAEMINGGAR
ncbi:glycosyltransferase family 4 protein [Nitrospira sp. M1]